MNSGFSPLRVFVSLCAWMAVGHAHAIIAQESAVQPPLPAFQTIAHEVLALEAESLGQVPDYTVLDDLLREAQHAISVTPPDSMPDALAILQRLATLLHTQHFRIGDAALLSQTLTAPPDAATPTHVGDCDSFSLLYLALGEVLNLPLRLVSLPEHTFIRWEFEDGAYLNWETTANTVWTDADYVDWHNRTHTAPITVGDLRPITRTEVLFLAHYNLGNTFTRARNYEAALTRYTASLTINPDYANAYYQRGQVWYAMGQYEQAIADFSQALEHHPQDMNARLNRGSAYNALGAYTDAIADFDRVLADQPDHVDARFNRGTAWLYSGDLTPALDDFNRVLSVRPNDADALALRGLAWSGTGQYQQAHDDLTRANTLNPWSADNANALAWLLATCPEDAYRDGAQAIQHALRAIMLQPALRMVYLDTLAAAYAEAGQFEQAVAAQQQAIRLFEAVGSSEDLAGYRQRLDLYTAGETYREYPTP